MFILMALIHELLINSVLISGCTVLLKYVGQKCGIPGAETDKCSQNNLLYFIFQTCSCKNTAALLYRASHRQTLYYSRTLACAYVVGVHSKDTQFGRKKKITK